jgi:hypothetical protein
MIMCRNVFTVIGILIISVFAVQPDQGFFAGKLHPCTGDSVWVTEAFVFNDITLQETIKLTVLGMSKEWTDFNAYYAERSDFIHGAIELAGLQCGGAGGATSISATAASATFKQAIFTHTALPRMAASSDGQSSGQRTVPGIMNQGGGGGTAVEKITEPELQTETESGKAVQLDVTKKETGPALTVPPNHVTTDLEWDLFKHKGASGNGFYLRAGYSRTLSDEKVTFGGTLIASTLLMMDKMFFNNALNLFGTYMLSESASLERKIGGAFNLFVVDADFSGAPVGFSGVVNFSDNWFVNGDNILTYGIMAQESKLADVYTTLLTAGVLYGLPVGERFALNADVIYSIVVLGIGKKGTSFDHPQMLQPAITFSTYFTRLFSLDAGLKTTLLVDGYADLIVTLGSMFLF